MPQANKKRGRRMESKKRKHEDAEDEAGAGTEAVAAVHDTTDSGSARKRRRQSFDEEVGRAEEAQVNNVDGDGYGEHGVNGGTAHNERAFFGVLDEEEQESFKRAQEELEANKFENDEERNEFIADLYQRAEGNELKLAQSQSCSRLLENVIALSTPTQLKRLFKAFAGNFIHLITHRFASHCCEALFKGAAGVVSGELVAPPKRKQDEDEAEAEVSMENLYLDTLAELEGSVGYLVTDRYASHVLRILLLIFAGEPLDTPQTKRLVQSKRKESNVVRNVEQPSLQSLQRSRSVPKSFAESLEQLIAESIAGLDTEKLRAFATHPNGNPTLQLLLRLEMCHFGKQRAKNETSVIRTLLPDDPITADSNSAAFINGLVYDPIGSHLIERIIEHAPGKMFKTLYQQFFKERLATHARNEVAGYVVCSVLGRLGHDDLLEAHEILIPHITGLLQKDRTVVVRTLVERCAIRDIDTQAIAVQVDNTWHGTDGFEVLKLVKFDTRSDNSQENGNNATPSNNTPTIQITAPTSLFTRNSESIKTHFNLLAQAMLLVPGSLSALVLDSLSTVDPKTLQNMATDPIVSRTLQTALTTHNASMITTRKLIQHFYGHIGEMALHTSASHVVDCIWEGTHGLAFIRERIAEELAENEGTLRASSCGRAVWRNWKMDLYKRRRADWVMQSRLKASNDGFQSFSELDANKDGSGATGGYGSAGKGSTMATVAEKKTPLQLARERHAKKKAKKIAFEAKAEKAAAFTNGGGSSSASAAPAVASPSEAKMRRLGRTAAAGR